MNKKGTRNGNGEGFIGTVIEKHKRKKFLDKECEICSNCTDRTACNNRTGYDKCQKCIDCKDVCVKSPASCDRFYCYSKVHAQISIDGEQTTVGNASKRRDAVEQKKDTESKVHTKSYIKKNGITLLELIKKVDNEKFNSGIINTNTVHTNQFIYNRIQGSIIDDLSIQNLTHETTQEFLDGFKYLSQSEIDALICKMKMGFNRAVLDKIIVHADNPMLRVTTTVSEQTVKLVQAFEEEEQRKIIAHLLSNKKLIKNPKCVYDEATIKNLILLGFVTIMRIGELGALDLDRINFTKAEFMVDRTLSRDVDGKTIMGQYTKTGKAKIKRGEPDERFVPFDLFDEDFVISILKEQIEIAKNNPNNKEKLLFCKKDGTYISHASITNLFKRICRELKIKLDLPKRMSHTHD